MSVPICPLLLQARASIPRLVVGWEDFRDGEKPASVTDGPLYPDPSQAPGVACIGSRCAWWESREDGRGVCARNLEGKPWPDPAAQEVPRG